MEKLVKKLHAKGLNDSEIAIELNSNSKKIWYIRNTKLKLPKNFSYSSKYDLNIITKLVKKGLIAREIAEQLNAPEISIYNFLKSNNLKTADPYQWKKDLQLTKRQREIIVGTLLGDSTVYLDKDCYNSRFTCSHSLAQEELVDWKYKELESLRAQTSYHTSKVDLRTGKRYKSKKVFTGNLPVLNEFRNMFYPEGIKIVPVMQLDDFSDLSLAILFMDDGSKFKSTISIATCSFSKENLKEFCLFLKGRFNLNFTIHADNSIYLRHKSYNTFKNIVEKHVIDCVKYKLN